MRVRPSPKPSSATLSRLRAVGIVRGIDHDERAALHDLESSGYLDGGERLGDDIVGDRRVEERLDRGDRDRRVVSLVRAVQATKSSS